ncbi:hypothetical protein EDB81DRAFT_898515 [Dactylonectria macrodidyma]|uniref:Actin-like ATPase domain-containing protein n=1 Tax=Dactylonectria macrodidyma TaxID=307937 RepID=A0A9P9FTT0_9HYPO|nr:hypothetical protein EDB81DRAFT_898515 [Dactylonectria macrodidyma]
MSSDLMAAMADDLVLGIDFGTTCTGVAYAFPGDKDADPNMVRTFQNWPGATPGANGKKVPTVLTYDASPPHHLLEWGFGAQNPTTTPGISEEWFKTRLGDSKHDQEHTKSLFRDYLGCVYTALMEGFPPSKLQGISWQDAAIKFIFSVPTTWRLDVVETFKELVHEAGFGRFERHQVQVGLPEPHAVAAFEVLYESGQFFNSDGGPLLEGKPVLFVDAGGGTTDFCVARMGESKPLQPTRLANVFTHGHHIGSTYIDQSFQKLIETQLRSFNLTPSHDAQNTAVLMRMLPGFENEKHRFGPHNDVDFQIPVPGLKDPTMCSSSTISSTIRGGVLRTRRCDLERLFDAQVQPLISDVDFITKHLSRNQGIHVEDILLSGGLGSSAYVQHRLREHICKDESTMARLHISTIPRLAVCHGLVIHALHGGVFHSHCSRVSFGLVCRVRKPRSLESTFQAIRTKPKRDIGGNDSDNKARLKDRSFFDRWGAVLSQAKEKGRDKVIDSSGRSWIDNCVDWFIKMDQVTHTDQPISRKFSTFFAQDLPIDGRICYVRIVTSTQSTPSVFGDGVDVGTHTFLKVDLSTIPTHEVEEKNTNLLSQAIGKKPHVKVEFLIEATIGLADAEIRCFDLGKRKILSQAVRVTANPHPSSGDSSHVPQTCIHVT